jgi:hypothetical protein
MHKRFALFIVTAMILSACASAIGATQDTPSIVEEQVEKSTSVPVTEVDVPAETPITNAPATEPPPTALPEPTDAEESNFDTSDIPPRGAVAQFTTDFSKHTVPYSEILSGGPPKDGIPAIDDPKFESVEAADEWLSPVEPVIFVQVGDDARAYPIQIFMWHEIVNDEVGGQPLVVTFCPLCNTGIAFERTVNGEVFDFGTTGRLRFSNLIMYDRQTETWWQQATGEAIAGELSGSQLVFYPAAMISWDEFKQAHPDGKVLSRDTGFNRNYGRNPYTGYDDVRKSPFLFVGPETPENLPAMARVLTVELGDETVAYPFDTLSEIKVASDMVGGTEIVVFWEPGTASALDASTVSGGQDVGTANAYESQVDGQDLTFVYEDGRILDEQTGSEWNVLGQATSGELQGAQLEPVVAINHFWFSWAAFKPETRIFQP